MKIYPHLLFSPIVLRSNCPRKAHADFHVTIDVAIEDGVVYDGCIHVLSSVLIPPKSVGGVMQEWDGEELEVEDLKERLTPQVDEEAGGKEQPFWRTFL